MPGLALKFCGAANAPLDVEFAVEEMIEVVLDMLLAVLTTDAEVVVDEFAIDDAATLVVGVLVVGVVDEFEPPPPPPPQATRKIIQLEMVSC